MTAPEDSGHLSRLATITRGSRKTLLQAGHANVTAVSTVTATDPVFDLHNALKADRNHLPHRATALLTGDVTIAANTTTIDFPKYADLQIFLSVNFDHGTGLLCALGSEARFRQRVPFGQTSNIQKNWAAEAQTLLTSTIEEERNAVISFLSRLARHSSSFIILRLTMAVLRLPRPAFRSILGTPDSLRNWQKQSEGTSTQS